MSNPAWPTIPLSKLTFRIGDGIHGTPIYTDGEGYPFINGNNLKSGSIEITTDTKFVTIEEYKKHFIEFNKQTLFLSINGTLGNLAKYKGEKMVLGKSAAYIKCSGIDVDFLYYYLQLKEVKALMWNIATGSTIKNLSLASIRNLDIPTPPDDLAKKIAGVLSTIDKKIELNNRINAELETMAKTLYDYWFVQFDFPDANGKPYRTSGGRMVYNEILKRDVPDGWGAESVLAVSDLLGGGTPAKTKPEYWHGTIPFFTPSDSDDNIFALATEDYISEEGLKKSSTRLFEKNTIFITARGSVGRLALNAVPMAMNQSCYALRPKKGISYSFLYFLTKELIHHLEVKASGSVFNSIVSNDIEFTNLGLPKHTKIIEDFARIAEPIFQKIEVNTVENIQLSSLRDWLLPMLMNGQITVRSPIKSEAEMA